MIFDPFRYAHLEDENDSTAMMGVMKHLRSYATAGAAVVIVHHPAKAEGSTGRGSSAIQGACDIAWTQELSDETGQITLRCGKNRCGDKPTLHVQADFELGTFSMVQSAAWTSEQEEVAKLRQINATEPELSQRQTFAKVGGKRNRVTKRLKEYAGREWQTEEGRHGAILYLPLQPVPVERVQDGIGGRPTTCTPVPTPIVGTGTASQPQPI
jgi:hypothetical protein